MGLSSLRNKFKSENSSSQVYTTSVDGSGEDVAHADMHLRRVKDQHKWDPFMDYEKIDAVEAAIASGDADKEAAVEHSILQEDSPYLEVRSSVSPLNSYSVSLHGANSRLGKPHR